MIPTFNGQQIFGTKEARQQGPFARTRNLRKRLPGVAGYRIFRLTGGKIDSLTWTVRARIVELSLPRAEQAVLRGLNFVDGATYPFVSTTGLRYKNCELTDFRPVSNYQRVRIGNQDYWTIVVQGTIEQASA